jgi:hypothetical protein
VLQLARLLIDLAEHEALEESVCAINLYGACHARCQLVAIPQEFGTKIDVQLVDSSFAQTFRLHLWFVLGDLGPPFLDACDPYIVGELLPVHDVIESGHRGGFRVFFRLFGWACKTPFHGFLEACEGCCVLRHD